MGNMSYCRFQNTVSDLADCWEDMELDSDASLKEKRARHRLINLACQIAANYGCEVFPEGEFLLGDMVIMAKEAYPGKETP